MDEAASSSVTVLRTEKNRVATKSFLWDRVKGEWRKHSFSAGTWFHPSEHPVSNLADLVDLLDQVRRDKYAFIVRGGLTPSAQRALAELGDELLIPRRKNPKNGMDPSLQEVPRQWIMLDIDNWPLPGWADLADDPLTVIDHAIHELLPEVFHDVECWWQLSSSAGFSVGFLNCHVFFWLTKPAKNEHLRAVFEQFAPGVDTALFNAVQPHYIADPVIIGGHDPIPCRTGWRRGLDQAVVLPELQLTPKRPKGAVSGYNGRAGDWRDALAFLGRGEGGQGFHGPLRSAAMRYARHAARQGDRDDEAVKQELRDAISAAPQHPGDARTYQDDHYLRRLIDGAFALLAGNADIQTMRPHHQPAQHTVEEARAIVDKQVKGFLSRALQWHGRSDDENERMMPEHAALVVDVGVGKSHAVRHALQEFIETSKRNKTPYRVLILVPTHNLGKDAFEAIELLGLNVAMWRGRNADVPGFDAIECAGNPATMCMDLEAVNDALTIIEDVSRSICGSGEPGEVSCQFRSTCEYQKQKVVVAIADIVIAPHQLMFHPLPKEIVKNLGLVIMDESWWDAGLAPNREIRIPGFAHETLLHPVISNVIEAPNTRGDRLKQSMDGTRAIHALSEMLEGALAEKAVGEFVSRGDIDGAGLTASDCTEAIKLEWCRKVVGLIAPGMSKEVRKKAVVKGEGNATIPRRAGIWTAIRDLLNSSDTHTGRLQIGIKADAASVAKTICLHSRMEINDTIASLPILLLDATAPVDVVKYFLPRVEVLAEARVTTPHVRVHQVQGGWGKTSIVPHQQASIEENQRRENLLKLVADYVSLNSGGNALVITYKAIEDRFSGLLGVQTGHFNAIAGLDAYRSVRSLFVIGRPLPDAIKLRLQALALTGRPIAEEAPQQTSRGALMADGTGAVVNVRAFTDPDLEALRVAITDAEMVQAIGRGRGVNRTADTPLDVFVLANVVLPLPLNRLCHWRDVRPDFVACMLARGAVLTSPADAAKAYSDLFTNKEAAKKQFQRGEAYFRDISLGKDIHRGTSPKLVRYRPAGRGQQSRSAWVMRPDARAWLEQVLDRPLVLFEEILPEPVAGADVAESATDQAGLNPAHVYRQRGAHPAYEPVELVLDMKSGTRCVLLACQVWDHPTSMAAVAAIAWHPRVKLDA